MKIIIQISLGLFFLLFAKSAFSQNDSLNMTPFTIGESISFYSQQLEQKRLLNIYLPSGYHPDSLKEYPVIYLLDGSADEDFIHIAGLVQFCSFPWIHILPETIVVGIANVDRKHDFTYPTKNEVDKADFPTTGGSGKFIQFLELELIPLIERSYKVGSEHSIIGQSLGGLLASEILLSKPHLFDNYLIISPSLWWDDESLLKRDLPDLSMVKSVYVGVGKEGEIMERVAKELHAKIEESDDSNFPLFFEFFEDQNHGDVLHLAAYSAFVKLFSSRE